MKHLQGDQGTSSAAPAWSLDSGWACAHADALARTFALLAGDIVLVLDEAGVILAAAQGEVPEGQGWAQQWVGRAWADTTTPENRGKVVEIVQDLSVQGLSRKREVNHPAHDGHPMLIGWTAIRLGERGPSLAVGRDLAAAALHQQRLLQVQAQLEASYWALQSGRGPEPGLTSGSGRHD